MFVHFTVVNCLVCLLIVGAVCQDLSVSLSMHPSDNGGKVVVNSTVVLRCTVNVNIVGRDTAEWYRRQGANRYQLGTDSFIRHHLTAARYRLKTESRTSSTAVYVLTISGNIVIIHINVITARVVYCRRFCFWHRHSLWLPRAVNYVRFCF